MASATISRRAALRTMGIFAAIAGTGTATAVVAQRQPTRAELERYYSLLWIEHSRLARELGEDTFDHAVLHRRGDYDEIKAAVENGPPSGRAKAILAAAGL